MSDKLFIDSQNQDADEAAFVFLSDKGTYRYPGAASRREYFDEQARQKAEESKDEEDFIRTHMSLSSIDNINHGE
jgi:hypothetical protein